MLLLLWGAQMVLVWQQKYLRQMPQKTSTDKAKRENKTYHSFQDDVRLTVFWRVDNTRAVDEKDAPHQSDVLPHLKWKNINFRCIVKSFQCQSNIHFTPILIVDMKIWDKHDERTGKLWDILNFRKGKAKITESSQEQNKFSLQKVEGF